MPNLFTPTHVDLTGSFPPFVATFERSEAECAAAGMVRALQVLGRDWESVTFEEISDVVEADVMVAGEFGKHCTSVARFIADMAINRFCRPSFVDLVERGYAERVGEDAIKFTDKGLSRLARWVRPTTPERT